MYRSDKQQANNAAPDFDVSASLASAEASPGGDVAAGEPAPTDALPKRPRGRPRGLPKPPSSGRKAGTPNRITRTIKELATPYALRAFRQLAKLIKSDDERVRLAAAKELLDRAYGRPVTPNEISGPDGAPLVPAPADPEAEEKRRIAWERIAGILRGPLQAAPFDRERTLAALAAADPRLLESRHD